MSEVIKRLEILGFSTYEAKAYCALLRRFPANAYEISKLAQIPPSKIYETMQKLKNRGAVLDSQNEPIKYLPVEPTLLLKRLQTETNRNIEFLIESLPLTKPVENFDITWNLKGSAEINAKIVEMISQAQSEVYASIWPEQYSALQDALQAAIARDVRLVAASFGEIPDDIGNTFNLSACALKSLNRLGSQISTVVVDNREVVIGELTAEPATSKGVWTKTPSVILVAKEYIRHDILVNHIVQQIGIEQYNELCDRDSLVRFIRTAK